jgi:CBS domain-containing protein
MLADLVANCDSRIRRIGNEQVHSGDSRWDEFIGIVDRGSMRKPLVRGSHLPARRSRKNKRISDGHLGREVSKMKPHSSKFDEGEVMIIAKRPVTTASLTTTVYDVVHIMAENGFRRIPVVDPNTNRLQGIVTSTDMVNYLGGGAKFQIIQQEFKGSFYKAINSPIKAILSPNPPSIRTAATISDAVRLMTAHRVGGLPVVDNADRVLAIVTERDLLSFFKDRKSELTVADLMASPVVTMNPATTILEAERAMIEKSFRRLPIVSEGALVGIVTAMDIVRFFGSGEVFQHLRSGNIHQVLQTPALKIGTQKLVTIGSGDRLNEATRIMHMKNIGALLVLDQERLVGIITERDFFKLVSE